MWNQMPAAVKKEVENDPFESSYTRIVKNFLEGVTQESSCWKFINIYFDFLSDFFTFYKLRIYCTCFLCSFYYPLFHFYKNIFLEMRCIHSCSLQCQGETKLRLSTYLHWWKGIADMYIVVDAVTCFSGVFILMFSMADSVNNLPKTCVFSFTSVLCYLTLDHAGFVCHWKFKLSWSCYLWQNKRIIQKLCRIAATRQIFVSFLNCCIPSKISVFISCFV